MDTGASYSRDTQPPPDRSLGAVLAEREVDERTYLVVVRADVSLGPALALARRLLGLRRAGFTTVIVQLPDSARVADVLLAALMRCRRELDARQGRMVVATANSSLRATLARAGLEIADDCDDR